MFNFKNISKIVLITGALLFASSYYNASYAADTSGPVGGITPGANTGTPKVDKIAPINAKTTGAAANAVGSMEADAAVKNKQKAMLEAAQTQKDKEFDIKKQLAEQQEKLSEAKTKDDIKKAKEAIEELNGQLKQSQEKYKTQQKAAEKELKGLQSEAKKASKTTAKETDKLNDNLKDADKEVAKLEKKVKDGKATDKDIEKLAAAKDKQEDAKASVDDVNKAKQNEALNSNIKKSKAKVDAADANLNAAQQELEKVKQRKDAGTATAAELKAAEDKLRNAKIDKKAANNLLNNSTYASENGGKEKPAETPETSVGSAKQNADELSQKYKKDRAAYSETQNKIALSDKACTGGDEAQCTKAEQLKEELNGQKTALDETYKNYKDANEALQDARQYPQEAFAAAEDKKKAVESEYDSLRKQHEEAQKACAYSKNLTSKKGQADAQKYCGQEEALAAAMVKKQEELAAANKALEMAQVLRNVDSDEHEGQEFKAFEDYKVTTKGGQELKTGTYDGKIGQDVLQTITRRAFQFIVALKPIIYVLAGFGLIAFAFMAIFNKLSWKWFSNIAIGLFLVANMGRFIEYFVYPTSEAEQNPAALSYGDHLSKGFADTRYEWVDEMAAYTPPSDVEAEGLPDKVATLEEDPKAARGFCGKTEGASGWGNFSSCIKDITAAGRKAVDTAKTVQSTVQKVKSGVESVKFAAQNIGDAVKNAQGGGLSGIIKAAGEIGSNVNHMVGTTTGVVGGVMSNASKIANNVQDVSKSTDQVDELNKKRAQGEGTNAIDRALKGQVKGIDGKVERDYEGNIISDKNVLTTIKDTNDAVNQKVKEGNKLLQDISKVGYEGAKMAEDVLGITDKLQDKKKEKAEKEAQKKSDQKQAERDQKTQAANDVKLVEDYKKQQEAANKPVTSTDKAKDSVKAAQEAATAAKQAESEAKAKANSAQQADKAATQKADAAKKADAAAKAAAAKAEATGSEADIAAAKLAAARADIAKSEAAAASLKAKNAQNEAKKAEKDAQAAKEPLKELADEARGSVIDEAKAVQEKSKAEIEEAKKLAKEAQNSISAKEKAATEAKKAAEAAAKIAAEKQDAPSIRAAQEAAEKAKKAENDVAKTKQEVANQEKRQKDAELRILEAKAFEAKMAAEKELGLTAKDDKEIQQQEKEADKLREQYEKNNNPEKEAELARTKAAQAAAAAKQAESAAKQKADAAAATKEQAKKAAEKAAASKDPVDQRVATQAAKRAELAAQEAQDAKEKAAKAKEPVTALENAARGASLDEAKYVQEKSREEAVKAENAINDAKDNAQKAAMDAKAAQEEAQRAAEAAAKYNTAESIIAAKEAAVAASKKQQEAQAAQRKIDEEIRRRNEAEMRAQEAAVRQAELEKNGAKTTVNNSGADVLSNKTQYGTTPAVAKTMDPAVASNAYSGNSIVKMNPNTVEQKVTVPATQRVAPKAQVAKDTPSIVREPIASLERTARQAELEKNGARTTANNSRADVLSARTQSGTAPAIAKAPDQTAAQQVQTAGNVKSAATKAQIARDTPSIVRESAVSSEKVSRTTDLNDVSVVQEKAVTRGVVNNSRGEVLSTRAYADRKVDEQLQKADEEHQAALAEQRRKASIAAQSQATRQLMEERSAEFRAEQDALVAQKQAEINAVAEQQRKLQIQEQSRAKSEQTNRSLQERDVKKMQQLRLERARQMRLQKALSNDNPNPAPKIAQ